MSALGERFALAQIFRQSCEACGARGLAWMCAHEAPTRLGTVAWLRLASRFPAQIRDELEVWQCTSCGNAGAFTPPEVL